MPALTNSLLPPNATAFERAIEAGVRLVDVTTAAAVVDDPAACPAALLPWLAWGLSVDTWDTAWSEADKRDAVARSIEYHRQKGTRLSVDRVLARFDQLTRVIEWHEAEPRRTPHTFEIHVPMVTGTGQAVGGARSEAAFAETIIREIARVQPLREHLTLAQTIVAGATIGLVAAGRPATYQRDDYALVAVTDPVWGRYLQTPDGEPLADDTGDYLEDAA